MGYYKLCTDFQEASKAKCALGVFKRNLLHKQQGQNFNSQGMVEIPEIALQEIT